MKLIPDAVAMAWTSIDFPVPGGPYRRIPEGTLTPSRANTAGLCKGSIIIFYKREVNLTKIVSD